MRIARFLVWTLALSTTLVGVSCGGGGGGGGGSSGVGSGSSGTGSVGAVPATKADQQVKTYATTGTDGAWSQVDLIPVLQGSPSTTGSTPAPNVGQASLLATLQTTSGTDINNNWTGASTTLPTAGFDAYTTGLSPGALAGFILGANNLYDMFQTTTGQPKLTLLTSPPGAFRFTGFNGGDIDSYVTGGNAAGDGGPGLFSNLPTALIPPGRAVPPKLPTLPNTMGTPDGSGGGRGPSATDEHQFIQIEFPYPLDIDSLFNPLQTANSFLGDSVGVPDNILVQGNAIQHPSSTDKLNILNVDLGHVPVVAVIGGKCAVPFFGGTSTIDPDPLSPTFSFVPTGAQAKIMSPNVLTLIAHESPTTLATNPPGHVDGSLTGAGILRLPSPTLGGGKGGRVFGATGAVVSSVNDFANYGATTANGIGFMTVNVRRLRTAGATVQRPYFHSFPFNQTNVAGDTRAPVTHTTFLRGPAVPVSTSLLPSIDILDPSVDAIGTYVPTPTNDTINTISTRARFLIEFDQQVVPNSVGFSRRHTIHRSGSTTIFPFNGNTRPIVSPSQNLAGTPAAPLAPSIYLAINQAAGPNKTPGSSLNGVVQRVASPFAVSGGAATIDSGAAFGSPGAPATTDNGLTPQSQNTLASLPRGIVPVDIYPLNQNNLQAYVVEPLVELPPNTIVTLSVCVPGLGVAQSGWVHVRPSGTTVPVGAKVNAGNPTRSGTMFTAFQGLTPTGQGTDASLKQAVLPNNAVIKVNAGPMGLAGSLMFGGTNIAVLRRVNGIATDDLTAGGFNVSRTFRVGSNSTRLYVNAPVAPQALYLGFSTGGAGVLDLSGTGYTTNAPGGAAANTGFESYLEVSRYLPSLSQSGSISNFNYNSNGSVQNGDQSRAFGILGRYSSGAGPLAGNVESDLAIGAPIRTGTATPQPGINEGSSGYETLVRSGIIGGDPSTSTQILAPTNKVGIVRDIEVGDFLDTVYFDAENNFGAKQQHRTYNAPLQGSLTSNTIADPPFPNPPPLRFPVGLPHTSVTFDQNDLSKAPVTIDGNEVFTADGFMIYDDGSGFILAQRQPNCFIQLNPVENASNSSGVFDKPHLPNAGFTSPFAATTGAGGQPKFLQTGPMPKTATAGAVILANLNAQAAGQYTSGGLRAPIYQSRQQIGNFLFAADGVNKKLHALNSNTMEVLHSLSLPDPYGLGMTADLRKLFVTNEGNNTVSVVDCDPTSSFFMTELKRTPVGLGPRAVACNPDGEDALVLNYLANTLSIVDITTGSVRKTISQAGLNRPWDVAVGPRETSLQFAFTSLNYHAFISNNGGQDTTLSPSVVVYQSGPDGLNGTGLDTIIGGVTTAGSQSGITLKKMLNARGLRLDPNAPTSGTASRSIGAFLAHQTQTGRAMVSRISYINDGFGGILGGGTNGPIFEVVAQYESAFNGVALDVATPDYNRRRFEQDDFGSFWNLLNAGATTKVNPTIQRNGKHPLADITVPAQFDGPRYDPDKLYLSVGSVPGNSGGLIEVFDLNGTKLKTINTPVPVNVLSTYFSQ